MRDDTNKLISPTLTTVVSIQLQLKGLTQPSLTLYLT